MSVKLIPKFASFFDRGLGCSDDTATTVTELVTTSYYSRGCHSRQSKQQVRSVFFV